MSREIIFALCFKNGILDRVDFCVDSIDLPSSWSDWSEEGELKRKRFNEELLSEMFSYNINQKEPPSNYQFRWGNAISFYDPRSGGSFVVLRYTNE